MVQGAQDSEVYCYITAYIVKTKLVYTIIVIKTQYNFCQYTQTCTNQGL